MFAIVETCGKQYRVSEGDVIVVDRMDVEEGSEITLDRVLLLSDKNVKVGEPTIQGAQVSAKVMGHPRGDKVIAFKFKRRQRYRRKVGFRHSHTTLEITKIKG